MNDDPFSTLGTVLSTFLGPSGQALAGQLEVAYDEGVIEDVLDVLTEAQTSLEKAADLRDTPAASYGSSPAGVALAHHAQLARQKVIDVLGDIKTGLGGYHTVVSGFRADSQAADEASSADLTTLSSAISCVNQPTVAAPSQCVAPASGGGA